ncbi:MAG: YkgJ family cysteine cluster protein [Chitinophagia bacterium]|nr:YkgJ family cysteine cluster protein [Chitinophagia bacterium]
MPDTPLPPAGTRPAVDLDRFRKQAKSRKKALGAFLNRLDELVPEDMDALVEATDRKVWEKIDCTGCANCCKEMTPTYTNADIARIAAHLGLKPAKLIQQYLKKDEDSGEWINQQLPCPFLVNDLCSIYAVRPADCAEFPHHNKRPFDSYNETYLRNLPYCPATLLLVHRLKQIVERDYEW